MRFLTKTIFLTLFLLAFKVSFGQCSKAYLLNSFIDKNSKYNTVTFSIKKTVILFNSFDFKTSIDTIVIQEDYICSRVGDKVNYLKITKGKEVNSTILYRDSFFVKYTRNYASRKSNIWDKQSEFEEALYFLSNKSDTFKCSNGDSLVNYDNNSFNMFSFFEDQYGPGSVQLEFKFDSIGNLIKRESFYNQEYLIPKIYTTVEYFNFKHYTITPKIYTDKFKSEYKIALKSLKKTKSIKPTTNTYSKILTNFNISNFKPIVSKGVSHNLDSIIKSNKITIVYFWFQGCGPCAKVKPILSDLYNKYQNTGLKIIGLNDVDNEEIIDSTNTSYSNYMDKNKNIEYFKIGYPQIIIFNSKGEILGKMLGYSEIGLIELKNHIEQLLIQ